MGPGRYNGAGPSFVVGESSDVASEGRLLAALRVVSQPLGQDDRDHFAAADPAGAGATLGRQAQGFRVQGFEKRVFHLE